MNNFYSQFLGVLIGIIGCWNLVMTAHIRFDHLTSPVKIEIKNNHNLETEAFIKNKRKDILKVENGEEVEVVKSNCKSDLIFTTQAAIDTFICNCRTIEGDLIINGDDITDLSNLSCLENITGSLFLGDSLNAKSNRRLTYLEGLDKLSIIGEDLVICNNSSLRNLDGFSSLMEIGGDIQISRCAILEQITFINLQKVAGSFIYSNLPSLLSIGSEAFGVTSDDVLTFLGGGIIYENLPQLTWITGFGGLTFIPEDLFLANIPILESLEAFNTITHIGGSFHLNGISRIFDFDDLNALECIGRNIRLIDNAAITNLDQLGKLEAINGSLIIQHNENLTTLSGLHNLIKVADTLRITGNSTLSSCCGINDLLRNDGVGGFLMISQNLSGCMNAEDIHQNCADTDTNSFDCPELRLNIGTPCDDNDPNTEDEWVEEDCKCVGRIINGCNVVISVSENTINVEGVNDAHNKIYLYDRTFSNLLDESCAYWTDCEGDQTFDNLLPGVYAVQYQSFSEDWTKMFCDSTVYVEIAGDKGAIDCEGINVQVTGNKLVINNLPTLNTVIDVFDSEFSVVSRCVGDCGVEQTIENLASGNYFVRLKTYDTDWDFICEIEASIKIGGSIGKNIETNSIHSTRLAFDKLKIFPNPTVESVNIKVDNFIGEEVSITLYDMFGKVMQQHQLNQVNSAVFRMDVRGYNAGLYHVSLQSKGQLRTGKVFVLKNP